MLDRRSEPTNCRLLPSYWDNFHMPSHKMQSPFGGQCLFQHSRRWWSLAVREEIKTFAEELENYLGGKKPKAKLHYLLSSIGSQRNHKQHFFTKLMAQLEKGFETSLSVSYFNTCSVLFVFENTQRYSAFCLLYEDSKPD